MVVRERVEALWKTCREGDEAKVKQLFEEGLTLRDARTIRNLALRWACMKGHVEVVRLLFEVGGLTAEDARAGHNRPLFCACIGGHVEVARLLFEVGVTAEDARECSALRAAFERGHDEEVVRELLERGVRFERAEQLPGEERLHDAKTMWLVLEAGGGQCMPCSVMNYWYKKGGELGRMGEWRRSATSTEEFEARLLFKTIVVCRASQGPCENDAFCPGGTNYTCPARDYLNSTVQCHAGTDTVAGRAHSIDEDV